MREQVPESDVWMLKFGQIRARGRIQSHLPALHELHAERRGDDGLRQRGQIEECVAVHRKAFRHNGAESERLVDMHCIRREDVDDCTRAHIFGNAIFDEG